MHGLRHHRQPAVRRPRLDGPLLHARRISVRPRERHVDDAARTSFAEVAEAVRHGLAARTIPAAKRGCCSWSRKFDHCLNDLLYRYGIGELPVEITARRLQPPGPMRPRASARHPFHHLPVNADTKPEAEEALLKIIERGTSIWSCSPATCRSSPMACASGSPAGRSTSITRSCPASGRQALPPGFERGVKLIGATAHYVTAGPRRGADHRAGSQRVDHTTRPEDWSPSAATSRRGASPRRALAHRGPGAAETATAPWSCAEHVPVLGRAQRGVGVTTYLPRWCAGRWGRRGELGGDVAAGGADRARSGGVGRQ